MINYNIYTIYINEIRVKIGVLQPNSRRIPYNQTHCVDALTAALYLDSADESEMVCCFLID